MWVRLNISIVVMNKSVSGVVRWWVMCVFLFLVGVVVVFLELSLESLC